jgi:hypothetical protein
LTYVLWSKTFCKIFKNNDGISAMMHNSFWLTEVEKRNLFHIVADLKDKKLLSDTLVCLSIYSSTLFWFPCLRFSFPCVKWATIWNRFLFSTSVNQKLLCIIADIPSLFLNHSQVILTVSFGDGVHIKCKIKMIWCCFENHSQCYLRTHFVQWWQKST